MLRALRYTLACRWCDKDLGSQEDAHDCHQFSLRFKSSLAEAGFLRARSERLVRSSCLLAVIIAVLALLQGLMLLSARGFSRSSFENDGQFSVTQLQYLVLLVLAVANLTFAAFMKLLAPRIKVPLHVKEGLISLVLIVVMTAAISSDRYYMTRMSGYPISIWHINGFPAHFSDTRVLLAIDASITVAHLLMPIRWCVLVSQEIASVLLYMMLAFVFGSPEKGLALFNVVLLTTLVVASALGKRAAERSERQSFARLATERSLRAEAEFELSQLGRPHEEEVRGPRSEDASSAIPSTAPTEQVFRVDEAAEPEVALQLEQIASLGIREHWLIKVDDLKIMHKQVLGSGSYGMVVSGVVQNTPVAVKLPKDPANAELNTRHFISLANELRVLRHLRHPNIVHFYGACVIEGGLAQAKTGFGPSTSAGGGNHLALVLERVEGTSLDDYMTRGPEAPDAKSCYDLLLGISRALQYLHTREPCIVHGDLKPSNVLVEELVAGPRAKLVDFGLSRVLTRRTRPLGGTMLWMDPDVMRKGRPKKTSDVFSFGRLTFFVATRRQPLEGMTSSAIKEVFKSGRGVQLPWPKDGEPFPSRCQVLAEECMLLETAARPSLQAIVMGLETWLDGSGHLTGPHDASAGDLLSSQVDLAGNVTDTDWIFPMLAQPGQARTSSQRAVAASPRRLEAVAEEGGTQVLSPSVVGKPSRNQAYDKFKVTPARTLQISLCDLMLKWRVEARGQCCVYHATVDLMGRILAHSLVKQPCKAGLFDDLDLRQCQNCLALYEAEDYACTLCAGGRSSCSSTEAATAPPESEPSASNREPSRTLRL